MVFDFVFLSIPSDKIFSCSNNNDGFSFTLGVATSISLKQRWPNSAVYWFHESKNSELNLETVLVIYAILTIGTYKYLKLILNFILPNPIKKMYSTREIICFLEETSKKVHPLQKPE